MKLPAFYAVCGGSYEDAVARFQKEERVTKFLRMLPGDDSMDILSGALAQKDAPTAFRAAHTLKGLALNLGLTGLAASVSALTECLRGQSVMPPEADGLFERVRRDYGMVIENLEQLED